MIKTRLHTDPLLATKLLTFYASPHTGNLSYAQTFFHRFPTPNTFMWNAMIKAHSHTQNPEQSLHFYIQMLTTSSVSHNDHTLPFLLKACSRIPQSSIEFKQIHAHVLKLGFDSHIFTSNSLIQAYSKNNEIESASLVFQRMPEKNLISWTTIISSLVRSGSNKDALNLFHQMQSSGIEPDNKSLSTALTACARLGALDHGARIHSYMKKSRIKNDPILSSALIDMYAKCGDIDTAIRVFSESETSVGTWTAMISGLGIHGRGMEAVELFREMEGAGLEANDVTYTAVLRACSHAGLVEEGMRVMEEIEGKGKGRVEHYGCVVDMMSRAGMVREAREIAERIGGVGVWGAVMNGCRVYGEVEMGKEIGRELVDEKEEEGGRYVSLASVCWGDGEWEEACEVRKEMRDLGVRKVRGWSAIVGVGGCVRQFSAGDVLDAQTSIVYG